MQTTLARPPLGADLPCSEPWGIYLLRGGVDWVCVGKVGDGELGEMHVKTLRTFLKTAHIKLIWESEKMADPRNLDTGASDSEKRQFEHAADVYAETSGSSYVGYEAETDTTYVEVDGVEEEMECDDHGLAQFKDKRGLD